MRMDTNLRACDADEKLRGTEIGHETGVQTIGIIAEACSLRACMHDETERVFRLQIARNGCCQRSGTGSASLRQRQNVLVYRVDRRFAYYRREDGE